MSKDEMRAYLKLLSAVTAAEDLLSELQPFGDLRILLAEAITSAEAFLPASSYTGIDPSKLLYSMPDEPKPAVRMEEEF